MKGFEKWLDNLILTIARHGKLECHNCGTFNNKGYPCGCKSKLDSIVS